ncbi:germination protein YpeB [Haloimpatiens sp. FM7330]|uniref:germination protein YpeB n=1 Tax=Haloimpatiens sp. FM7330 TaxID=3298610 RepID=UPI00362EF7D9
MKMSKKRIIYTIISTLIIVFSTTFAILMTLERTDYRNYLQGEYSKNMYQLINSVQNIRSNLAKASIVGSKDQSIVVFQEIFRYSSIANDKLHSLPIEMRTIDETSKFLSQVGDFCFSLTRSASEDRELTEKDYKNINLLELESYELEKRLGKVLEGINEGKVRWGEIRKKTSGVLAKQDNEKFLSNKFSNIQKEIAQYPALIYDGPFSDNLLEIKPKINSAKIVSKQEAEKVVRNIVGNDRIQKIESKDQEKSTKMDSYRFHVTLKNKEKSSIVCEVTKHGGKVVYLLNNRGVEKSKINMDKAVLLGSQYLKKIGYKNMNSTYTLKYDNTAVISYVYNEGNVVVYPDQIKLKIAMDNGEVIGIEGEKYLIAHTDKRNIPIPKINQEEAKERVGKNLKINTVKLAVIPTETNKEVLCYEFNGVYKDKSFIVYIDAKTGYERRIIQIINTPNGQLTI